MLKARKFVQRRHWETSIWKSKAGNNPANCNHGKRRFQYVSAPLSDELTHLVHTISHRIARFLERQGLLERDMEQSYLILEEDDDPMSQIHRHSITYRIAVGAQQGQKVFTLQTLPPSDNESNEAQIGQIAGFSLHAGITSLYGHTLKQG